MTLLAVLRDGEVRALISHMLAGADWRVLVGASEPEAVDVGSTADFDLLLIEVSPMLDGRLVARRLRTHSPQLPVVYVTGWHGHPDFSDFDGETVLTQPFSRDELTEAIGDALRRAM